MGNIAKKKPHSLQTLQTSDTSVRNIFFDTIRVSLLEPPGAAEFCKDRWTMTIVTRKGNFRLKGDQAWRKLQFRALFC